MFCSDLGLVLESHVEYIVYVRAWYDDDSYAIFASNGINTDSSPPELSRATKVLDIRSATSTVDTDFLTSTSNVTFSWKGVFRDAQSAIKRYVVSISKTFGGHNMVEKRVTSSETQTTIAGLDMSTDNIYYGTVDAYNEVNLIRTAYTDGFRVSQTRCGAALNMVNHNTWDMFLLRLIIYLIMQYSFINAGSIKTAYTAHMV